MMKLSVFTGMLVLCGAVAACSSSSTDSTSTGSGGSGGSSGSSEGGSTGNGEGGTGSPAANSSSSSATTTGGGACEFDVSEDPACNACGTGACCDEITTCYGDETGALCFDAEGNLDPSLPDGAALNDCIVTNCEAECTGGGGGICDSGIGYQDAEGNPDTALNECLGAACCVEYNFCTSDATDIQACLDCLNSEEGGPLCDDVFTCEEESGCFGEGICGTSLSFGDAAVDACLTANCCTEFDSCIGDGSDPALQACVDCINAGGGPECDDVLACNTEFGCTG